MPLEREKKDEKDMKNKFIYNGEKSCQGMFLTSPKRIERHGEMPCLILIP